MYANYLFLCCHNKETNEQSGFFFYWDAPRPSSAILGFLFQAYMYINMYSWVDINSWNLNDSELLASAIMDKSVEAFYKTNAFKLTILVILFFWMKTHFSSVVNPLPPPKQCCKTLRWCLFVSNIEKGGRGGYLSRWERGEFTTRENNYVGNFHMSQQLLSMIVASEVMSGSESFIPRKNIIACLKADILQQCLRNYYFILLLLKVGGGVERFGCSFRRL